MLLAASGALALPALAFGSDRPAADNPRYWANASQAHASRLVSVSVLDFVDRTPFLLFPGQGRHHAHLAGEWGRPYRIQLRNLSGERLLVVVSVDGVNVVSGESANPQQAGYILPPYGEARIDGWRKSLSEVAQFVFAESDAAYASRTGRPQNVGVIGLAVFQERKQAPVELSQNSAIEERASSAPSAAASGRSAGIDAMRGELFRADTAEAMPQAKMGTGHGDRAASHATRGEFIRASRSPAEVVRLDYTSLASLESQGIARRRAAPVRPDPFPNGAFVQDPPRY